MASGNRRSRRGQQLTHFGRGSREYQKAAMDNAREETSKWEQRVVCLRSILSMGMKRIERSGGGARLLSRRSRCRRGPAKRQSFPPWSFARQVAERGAKRA